MALLERARKAFLFTRLVGYALRVYLSVLRRAVSARLAALTAGNPSSPPDPSEVKNVVVVGAAFAGYFAARILASSLPRDGSYRVVVVEPNSHFNFTWVLPRFCVVDGHEHKAFIPYTAAFFAGCPRGMVRWVRDRVRSVRRGSVVLRGGDEIPYEFLVIATGSTVADGLPSRVGAEDREEGIERLRAMQARIREATRVVVAGGGAAGVELAADVKDRYPDKMVTLVHSRQAVMHRFGPGLQQAAMESLRRLGVEVILGEKADSASLDGKFVTLTSGRKVECDCFVWPLMYLSPLFFDSASPSPEITQLSDSGLYNNRRYVLATYSSADQLHRAEAGIRPPRRSRPRRHRPVRPYSSQADSPDRRRLSSQYLCMRRRGGHQGAEPELENRVAAGRGRRRQYRPGRQGEEAVLHVRASLGRRGYQADVRTGEEHGFNFKSPLVHHGL